MVTATDPLGGLYDHPLFRLVRTLPRGQGWQSSQAEWRCLTTFALALLKQRGISLARRATTAE